MLNEEIGIDETEIGEDSVEKMPRKLKVKRHKRRLPSGKVVAVRGHTRSAPKKGVKKYTPKYKVKRRRRR